MTNIIAKTHMMLGIRSKPGRGVGRQGADLEILKRMVPFSSPELKAHVSFSDSLLSACINLNHIFDFSRTTGPNLI